MEFDEQPSLLVDSILDDVQLQNAVKINLNLLIILFKTPSQYLFFLCQRISCKRKNSPVSTCAIQQFDEIIAKRKEKRQCFDVCI